MLALGVSPTALVDIEEDEIEEGGVGRGDSGVVEEADADDEELAAGAQKTSHADHGAFGLGGTQTLQEGLAHGGIEVAGGQVRGNYEDFTDRSEVVRVVDEEEEVQDLQG